MLYRGLKVSGKSKKAQKIKQVEYEINKTNHYGVYGLDTGASAPYLLLLPGIPGNIDRF